MGKTTINKNWKEILKQRVAEGITVVDIAKEVGVSNTHLNNKMRDHKLTIKRYLHEEA